MNRWLILYILLLADWTSGQVKVSGVYDPNKDYEPMDDFLETRHRGAVRLPPCVKDLMNCWEVMNPDRVCKVSHPTNKMYAVAMDTICMDLRFQCREYMGYYPFQKDRNINDLFQYCYNTKSSNPKYGEWGLQHMDNNSGTKR